MLPVLLILGLGLPYTILSLHTEHVKMNISHVYHWIDDMFIGITIDSWHLRDEYHMFNLRNKGNLSKSFEVKTLQEVKEGNYTAVAGEQTFARIWDELNSFVHNTGLKLIFGLNVLTRKNGKWDPSNAQSLFDYSSQKGYPIAGFELGNEPGQFHHLGAPTVTESQLATDFQELRQVLLKTVYKSSLLLGPDTSNYKDTFIKNFLSSGGAKAVDVVTFHHYYFDGRKGQLADFTNPAVLDHLKSIILQAFSVAYHQNPPKPVWIGETSSAYAQGVPEATGRYVEGVLWMDKQGLSARYGIKALMKQSLYGGRNGLLVDRQTPSPNYWLTLLYKRLVGREVFDVKTSSNKIRVYAHCTKEKNQFNYDLGSLTVYAVNLNTDSVVLQFPDLLGQHHLDVFWLTPEKENLQSENVQLNGETLGVVDNNNIPHFSPKTITTGSVTVPKLSYGFIVIPTAGVAACKHHEHGGIIG